MSAMFKLGQAAAAGGTLTATPPRYTPQQLSAAIRVPETGSQPNPWIRTKVRTAPGGSTAWGTHGLTNTMARDYKVRFPKLFAPSELSYLDQYGQQAKLFTQHGNMAGKLKDYNPVYDYGGTGHLGQTPEQQKTYSSVVEKMLGHMYERAGYDLPRVVQSWRGVPPSADPKYYQTVYDQLGYKPQSAPAPAAKPVVTVPVPQKLTPYQQQQRTAAVNRNNAEMQAIVQRMKGG